MSRPALFFMVLASLLSMRCASLYPVHEDETRSSSGFLRVEQLPEGEQTKPVFGEFAPDVRNVTMVQWIYDAPFSTVWNACNAVAGRFEKIGKRPIVKITKVDDTMGRIQNGEVTGGGAGRPEAGVWADEFVLEATSVSPERTRVTVSRSIATHDESTWPGETVWQTRWSNGRIEWWLLTKIGDEIVQVRKREREQRSAAAALAAHPERTVPAAPGEKRPLPAGTVLVETIKTPMVEMVKVANVRAKATTRSAVIAILNKGYQVEVQGKLRQWYRIKLPRGNTGWVHKMLVKQVE